jgi:hypothetical protein
VVISESTGPVERLNSRSRVGHASSDLRVDLTSFLGLGVLSELSWREKSRSIEDSSVLSLSFANEFVAELPLLSDELEEFPRARPNGR